MSDVFSNEIEFYRRQSEEVGKRVVQLVEEQARVKREARRTGAVARLIRETYPLTRLDAPITDITNLFLQTVINTVVIDNAALLRYDTTEELLVVEQALGAHKGEKSISLLPSSLKEFCMANSRSDPDLLLNELRIVAGVPYFLFAFHSESGLGLLLGNRTEDRNLHFPFDEKDREVVEGALHVLIYIIDHKQTEKIMKDNEEHWRTILQSIQTGIMLIDAESHQIQYVNGLASDIIGTSSEELRDVVCHKIVCPADIGKCPITDLNQDVDRSERILLSVTGERIPIIKSVVPLVLNGRKVLLESFVDIRDRKRFEEELQQHVEETEKVNRLMRGRENRILELKGIINDLLVRLGEVPRYASVSALEDEENAQGRA